MRLRRHSIQDIGLLISGSDRFKASESNSGNCACNDYLSECVRSDSEGRNVNHGAENNSFSPSGKSGAPVEFGAILCQSKIVSRKFNRVSEDFRSRL
jgi:hypothetical protein